MDLFFFFFKKNFNSLKKKLEFYDIYILLREMYNLGILSRIYIYKLIQNC